MKPGGRIKVPDGTLWPVPGSERAEEVMWRLVYGGGLLTYDDRIFARDVMSAFAQHVHMPRSKRDMVVLALRRALTSETARTPRGEP